MCKVSKLLTSVLVVLLLTGCDSKKEVPEDIGLQFYSLRNQFKKDVPATLKIISDWGIRIIEGGETYGMELDEFKELVDQHGLEVVSIGASYEQLNDSISAVLERAHAFGAKYVMCPWIPHKGDEFTIEDTKAAIALFNRAGKVLAEEGISLVYHAHGYEFRPYEGKTLFDYMAEQAENFDFEMDVYWFTHGGADPMAYLNTYPEKFKLMHLKDMRRGVQGNDTGREDVETQVVLGKGAIDIAALVQRGRELGVEYMFIEDESSRVVEQVPKSLRFLIELP